MESSWIPQDEELLNMASLQEAVGGFIHEMAQPLSAIVLAIEVIQMRLANSILSQSDKSYFSDRLQLVSTQASRAKETMEVLRSIARCDSYGIGGSDLGHLVISILGLLEQQFHSRGIALNTVRKDQVYLALTEYPVAKIVIIQAVAFARDTIQAIGEFHQEQSIPYSKVVDMEIINRYDGRPLFQLSWPLGRFPPNSFAVLPDERPGILLAQSVLHSRGGSMEITSDSIKVLIH